MTWWTPSPSWTPSSVGPPGPGGPSISTFECGQHLRGDHQDLGHHLQGGHYDLGTGCDLPSTRWTPSPTRSPRPGGGDTFSTVSGVSETWTSWLWTGMTWTAARNYLWLSTDDVTPNTAKAKLTGVAKMRNIYMRGIARVACALTLY